MKLLIAGLYTKLYKSVYSYFVNELFAFRISQHLEGYSILKLYRLGYDGRNVAKNDRS